MEQRDVARTYFALAFALSWTGVVLVAGPGAIPITIDRLMTLGPAIALMPFADRVRGVIADAINVIGRVPFFYYLAHIPLIHLSALAVNAMRTGAAHQDWYGTAPYTQVPEDLRWPLWLLYAVFAVDVLILQWLCRAYARRKSERPRAWMRYV